jgi:hypothetical protein
MTFTLERRKKILAGTPVWSFRIRRQFNQHVKKKNGDNITVGATFCTEIMKPEEIYLLKKS